MDRTSPGSASHDDVAELAQALFEGAGDALFLFDPEGEQVLDVNPIAQRLTGFSRQQLLGTHVASLFRSEVDGGLARLRHAFRKRGVFHAQEGFFLRHERDGHWIPVNLTITRLHTESEPLGLITARDVTDHKHAEEQLRRRERQYRSLVETSNDLIWSVDAEGRWTFVNRKAAMTIYGYEPEEMLGRPFTDFLDPILVEKDLAVFERLKTGQAVYHYETVHLRKDGTPVALSFNAIALYDENGRVMGTTGTAADITERKLAAAALRDSQERFEAFMRNSPAPAFVKDPDGRHMYVNRAMEQVNQAAPGSLLGKTDFDLWPEGIAQALRANDAAVLREDRPRQYLEKVPTADGKVRDWYVLKFPFRDAAGRVYLGGMAIDLTERRQAEEALRASEAKYRCLIESLEQCVFLKDRELRFSAVNGNFCNAVSRREEEVLGKTDFDLYPPELAEKYRLDDLLVLNEGRVLQVEEENLQLGRIRRVRVTKTPVKDSAGQPIGVLGIFWDITDQVNLEAQLRHAQKMDAVGQLAGGIAHDFNNLLTVILGNLSYVLNRPNPNLATALDLLRDAEEAALRAADLTQRLLGFSRRTMLRSTAVHLNQAVLESVRLLRRTIDPRIVIHTALAEDLWPAQADPGMINQVLMNLALNARDAMPKGGELRVRTSNFVPDDEYLRLHLEARPGAFVRLTVADTGTGMPPEVRQRIFEPFFTTKEVGKGTGLGLAMVFGIVKQHHGWIVCDSEVGRGTVFDIFLPRAQADVAVPLPPPVPTAPTGHETILVVDDESLIRNLAALILRRCGYRVVQAEDGLQALEILRDAASSVDLVVLDGTMPRLSGRETLRELERLYPQLPVLFSSGYATDHNELNAYPQIVGFIQKPYRVEDLATQVRGVLDRLKQTR